MAQVWVRTSLGKMFRGNDDETTPATDPFEKGELDEGEEAMDVAAGDKSISGDELQLAAVQKSSVAKERPEDR